MSDEAKRQPGVKTVYIAEGKRGVWEAAEVVAKIRGTSTSALIVEAIESHPAIVAYMDGLGAARKLIEASEQAA